MNQLFIYSKGILTFFAFMNFDILYKYRVKYIMVGTFDSGTKFGLILIWFNKDESAGLRQTNFQYFIRNIVK